MQTSPPPLGNGTPPERRAELCCHQGCFGVIFKHTRGPAVAVRWYGTGADEDGGAMWACLMARLWVQEGKIYERTFYD